MQKHDSAPKRGFKYSGKTDSPTVCVQKVLSCIFCWGKSGVSCWYDGNIIDRTTKDISICFGVVGKPRPWSFGMTNVYSFFQMAEQLIGNSSFRGSSLFWAPFTLKNE